MSSLQRGDLLTENWQLQQLAVHGKEGGKARVGSSGLRERLSRVHKCFPVGDAVLRASGSVPNKLQWAKVGVSPKNSVQMIASPEGRKWG